MTIPISANYRELTAEEAATEFARLRDAWKDPAIPRRQWQSAVAPELAALEAGKPCAPFRAFLKLVDHAAEFGNQSFPLSLLDVGASSGYYWRVLQHAARAWDYTGCDFSEAFALEARLRFPTIDFHVCDAAALPFPGESLDLVNSGCVLIHSENPMPVLREAARVSRRHVILHRTPFTAPGKPTRYWVKEAYGVPCGEVHYNRPQMDAMLAAGRLRRIATERVCDLEDGGAMESILCEVVR